MSPVNVSGHPARSARCNRARGLVDGDGMRMLGFARRGTVIGCRRSSERCPMIAVFWAHKLVSIRESDVGREPFGCARPKV